MNAPGRIPFWPPAADIAAWLTPARLVMASFFIMAAGLNNWFPRIPDIQAKLGIGPAELSVCLLGMPIGGFIATSIAARIIQRTTARSTLIFGLIVYCTAQVLPGWAWNVPSLFAFLFVVGATYVTIDLAVNVEAARIQDTLGRRIMSTCHGFWSLGSMLGLVGGAAFAEAHVDTRWHLLLVALIVAPLGVLVARRLPVFATEPKSDEMRAPLVALPSVPMIGLCVFAFGVILAELTTRNWGAVYLREVMGASPAATGIGYGAFSLFMAGGRFFGDRLTDRYGPVALGRVCGAVAVLGVLAVVGANSLPLAVAGFAALGIGVSVGFPLAVSAAAAVGDRPPAINVASLSLIAYSGALVGPPLVGFVAESQGLRIGLATILPLMILSAVFAGALRKRS